MTPKDYEKFGQIDLLREKKEKTNWIEVAYCTVFWIVVLVVIARIW